MNVEDLTEIDRAGRRCAVCRSGRHWRQFKILRPEGREPVVMCAGCRARFGDAPPTPGSRRAAAVPASEPTSPSRNRERPSHYEDRLQRVLRELPPGEHSIGRIAKAARLNATKALGRLRELEASGEVRQVGKRWSTEPPPSDVDRAFDRLQARTSNLRIVRDRSRVGSSADH